MGHSVLVVAHEPDRLPAGSSSRRSARRRGRVRVSAGDLRRWATIGVLAALLAALAAVLVRTAVYALYPFPFRGAVQTEAARYRVDPLLVLAVMRTESKFDANSLSRRGARGLMQVEPSTGAWIAEQIGEPFSAARLYDPQVSIRYGTWYLAELQRQFPGHLPAAIAAYNAGPPRVRAWMTSGAWSGGAADLRRVPYPETRVFVARVLSALRVYRQLYGRS